MSTSRRKNALGNNSFDALDLLVPAATPAAPVAAPAEVTVETVVQAPPKPVVSLEKMVEIAVEQLAHTAVEEPAPVRRVLKEKAKVSEPATPRGRSKVTFTVSAELLEQCKNAVDFLSGPPVRLTLVALVENALRKELTYLRNKHHEGEKFPQRERPLRPGRPMR